jgi:ketosteroid isomerase-like protein
MPGSAVSGAAAQAVEARAEGALQAFAEALSAGDLRAASACFTRAGCMITPDGTAVHGRAEITALLAQLIARRTEVSIEQLVVRQAGDVALAGGRLTLRSAGPEGTPVEQSCGPSVTLRLIEGSWKIAILAPWAANVTARS